MVDERDEMLKKQFHEAVEAVLREDDYKRRHTYIGKDGKDYNDRDTMEEVNEQLKEDENPKISSSFRR